MEEDLYSYVFHYNPYTKLWTAIPTAKYTDYFSGMYNKDLDGILESKAIGTLVDLIYKGEEFVKSIQTQKK